MNNGLLTLWYSRESQRDGLPWWLRWESACSVGDLDLIPGLGRSPGGGKGYPLPFSGLENSMHCIVHEAAKSWTRLRMIEVANLKYCWTTTCLPVPFVIIKPKLEMLKNLDPHAEKQQSLIVQFFQNDLIFCSLYASVSNLIEYCLSGGESLAHPCVLLEL